MERLLRKTHFDNCTIEEWLWDGDVAVYVDGLRVDETFDQSSKRISKEWILFATALIETLKDRIKELEK